MPYSKEQQALLAPFREQETLSISDLKQIVTILRADRKLSAEIGAKKAKAIKVPKTPKKKKEQPLSELIGDKQLDLFTTYCFTGREEDKTEENGDGTKV